MKPLLSLLLLLVLFSCSKDQDSNAIPENLKVSGKYFAPNNIDPIANAKVTATQNENIINETYTNDTGEFILDLPAGNYSLSLKKGLFSTEKDIVITEETTLENYKIETLPKIGVVTGHYDNIENVLYDIGLVNPINGEPLFDIIDGVNITKNKVSTPQNSYHDRASHSNKSNSNQNPLLDPNVTYDFGDLVTDPLLLGTYDIIFLNCGLNESLESYDINLYNYVNNGGFMYATDWASGYLNSITNGGANYLNFLTPEKSGSSLTTTATLLNSSLNAWLLLNFGITINATVVIDEFLPGWQVVDSYNPNTCVSWLNGEVTYSDGTASVTQIKDLAFTFIVGNGAVFYSSFHTENEDQGFTKVDRIMEYLVFEMSDIQ